MRPFRQADSRRIILASRSPRRQQLLSELGFTFEVRVIDYDESWPDGLVAEQIAGYVAAAKAELFRAGLKDDEILIAADTIVWCNEKVLGKPENEADAVRILKEISGNTHKVITGVTILSNEKELSFTETTEVTFDFLSDEEIMHYIKEFRPFDKAGAYGIQEWIGVAACTRIEGSYFNVVGLPSQRLYRELKKFL